MKSLFPLLLLFPLYLGACGADSQPSRTNAFVPLTSIAIESAHPSIAKETSNRFTAVGDFSGSFTRDITAEVSWSSSDPSVVTFDNGFGIPGLASGIAPGTVTINAALGNVRAERNFSVSDALIASVLVSPKNSTLAQGLQSQFAATGTFSDASLQDITLDAAWTSSEPGIATVSDQVATRGLATALVLGNVAISAAFGGVSDSAPLTVTDPVVQSIAVTPARATIKNLANQQFRATGTLSNGAISDVTTQVVWSSLQRGVATIDTAGVATAVAPGAATIQAELEGIPPATATLNVTGSPLVSIQVSPRSPNSSTIVDGTSVQFEASGSFSDGSTDDLTPQVVWTSDTETVATIAETGVATAVGPGSSIITATLNEFEATSTLTVVSADLLAISVDPPTARIANGTTAQFTAEGSFSGGITQVVTRDVAWESSNTTVATISNEPGSEGLATAVASDPAPVDITATLNDIQGIEGLATLTVTPAVLLSITLSPPGQPLRITETFDLTLTGNFNDGTSQDLTDLANWTTDNPAAATVGDTAGFKGRVKGVARGIAVITAEFGGESATTEVEVVP